MVIGHYKDLVDNLDLEKIADEFIEGRKTRENVLGKIANQQIIDFALSFGAVIAKIIDFSKSESRDFFGIILDQKNSQKLHLLPKSCKKLTEQAKLSVKMGKFLIRFD